MTTLVDARRRLREATRDHSYEETPLGPWVKRHLDWREGPDGRSRPRTVDDVERTLARMAIECADRPLEESYDENLQLRVKHGVTTDDLRAVIATYPKGSWHKVTAHIRSFWKWMVLEEYVDRDPSARLRSPKPSEPLTYDIFTEDEEAALITRGPDRSRHSAIAVRDKALVLLLLRTGIRNGELRNLKVSDIDLSEKWIMVREGKGGKDRVVPYAGGAGLGLALEQLMLTNLPLLGRPLERDEYVFWGYYPDNATYPGVDGVRAVLTETARSAPGAQGWWKKLVARSGVRYRKMHMCRHTVATKLVQSNAKLATVQRILGHADIKTTLGYTHLQIADLAEAVEGLEVWREARA